MNGKLNKILPLAGLFCGSIAFASIFADADTNTSSQTTTMKEITPPAGFASQQGIGFSVYGDFIYWEARQANTQFATLFPTIATTSISSAYNVYFPGFKYKPGFKVGIDFDLGHDNWDLEARYTWLNGSDGTTVITADPDSTNVAIQRLIPSYRPETAGENVNKASGKWDLHYNLINLDLGRDYYISQFLTLRPYFGLAGAWNNQKERVEYTYIDDNSVAVSIDKFNIKQNYWGIGFDTGLNTNWFIDKNWSIYGNFGYMNLWSKYRNQTSEKDYALAADFVETGAAPTVYQNFQAIQYGFQNVLDLGLGLQWCMTFDEDTMGMSIQLGWEQQVWLNHAQYTESSSNLSLQGFNAQLRLDF